MNDADREAVLREAFKWKGTKFLAYGRNEQGIDCAGLIQLSAMARGLPWRDDTELSQQASQMKLRLYREFRDRMDEIPPDEVKPGSALLFWKRRPYLLNHCALYVGDNKVIDAREQVGTGVHDMVGEHSWDHVFAAFDYRQPGAEPVHRVTYKRLRGYEIVGCCEECVNESSCCAG